MKPAQLGSFPRSAFHSPIAHCVQLCLSGLLEFAALIDQFSGGFGDIEQYMAFSGADIVFLVDFEPVGEGDSDLGDVGVDIDVQRGKDMRREDDERDDETYEAEPDAEGEPVREEPAVALGDVLERAVEARGVDGYADGIDGNIAGSQIPRQPPRRLPVDEPHSAVE